MIPLPYLTVFRVRGPDAATFLHGQMAADLENLDEGDATFSAYCSPRGQVIAMLLIQRTGNDWLLAGHSELMEPVIERLRRFVLRADVQFEAETGSLAGVPKPGKARGTVTPGGTGLHYVFGNNSAAAPETAVSDWRWRELEQGVSWLGPASSERFIPQMIGLDRIGAVSFSKGCFPGQEVIARARYLGKVKRGPVLVAFRGLSDLAVGDDVSLTADDQSADGVVVELVRRADDAVLVVVVSSLDESAPVRRIEHRGENAQADRIQRLD
ncbi:CAF17-like 4Fe-4S cluster assembly/insertion protein YgfZ [Elongatibacter sediminis]|uniref:CAF17-like 4Fe-4S cluster assembly/insertion protein YgfZ n=1 Tax=Elongatibacter sediminis TaxID=3119006 RepID=UPI00339D7C5A